MNWVEKCLHLAATVFMNCLGLLTKDMKSQQRYLHQANICFAIKKTEILHSGFMLQAV